MPIRTGLSLVIISLILTSNLLQSQTTNTGGAIEAEGNNTLNDLDLKPIAPRVDDIFLRLGPDVDHISLPAFTSGNGKLTYTFSSTPSLPQGVAFDARGLRISFVDRNGDQNSPAKRYTYTATDEDGDSASATVSITVIDAYPIATTIPKMQFLADQPIYPKPLPAFETTSEDNPTLTYKISDLPDGLYFIADKRTLLGAPRYFTTANIWYEATDGVDIVRTPLIIEVEADTQPVGPTQPQSFTFTVSPSRQSIILEAFTGGNGTLTYAMASTPSFPDWITFNPTSREITIGNDTALDQYLPTTTYTYTATDEDGDTISATFTLAVKDSLPSFGDSTIASIVATLNSRITDIALPAASSSTGDKTYSISPSVPEGLAFNSSTRVLSGTPSVINPTTIYTYTATDTGGDTTSLLFTITAEADKNTLIFSSPTFNWILILGLIFLTVSSWLLLLWTNYMRTVYLKDGPALVPEKWGKSLKNLTADTKDLTETSRDNQFKNQISFREIQKSSEENRDFSNRLLESFLDLQNALTKRDEEISRLKKGYDSGIYKKFLYRFIRLDRTLREMENEFIGYSHQKNYTFIKRQCENALEECGVKQFIPEVGVAYSTSGPEIEENPKIFFTNNAKDDDIIAKVISGGYILYGDTGSEVIYPAKVAVYRYKANNKE